MVFSKIFFLLNVWQLKNLVLKNGVDTSNIFRILGKLFSVFGLSWVCFCSYSQSLFCKWNSTKTWALKIYILTCDLVSETCLKHKYGNFPLWKSFDLSLQKQPSRGVLSKSCSENMQQIYRKTPTPKCDFNKVAKQL